jgi:hypothetical protein
LASQRFSARAPARRERNRNRGDDEARHVMRRYIDRVEMQSQRQHHHGVLRAGRERHRDVGDREGKQICHDQHEQRGDRERHRERAERGAEVAGEQSECLTGKA